MTINQFMSADHKACDTQFAELENIVDSGNFDSAKMMFDEFKSHLLQHFKMEEEVMFVEYRSCEGGHCDPTGVMVMEHDQMRHLLDEMEDAINENDKNKFLGLSENLLFVMQQHNMKEEQMMYNFADDALDSENIIAKMQNLG